MIPTMTPLHKAETKKSLNIHISKNANNYREDVIKMMLPKILICFASTATTSYKDKLSERISKASKLHMYKKKIFESIALLLS